MEKYSNLKVQKTSGTHFEWKEFEKFVLPGGVLELGLLKAHEEQEGEYGAIELGLYGSVYLGKERNLPNDRVFLAKIRFEWGKEHTAKIYSDKDGNFWSLIKVKDEMEASEKADEWIKKITKGRFTTIK